MIEIKVVEIIGTVGEELGIRWGYDRGLHAVQPPLNISDFYKTYDRDAISEIERYRESDLRSPIPSPYIGDHITDYYKEYSKITDRGYQTERGGSLPRERRGGGGTESALWQGQFNLLIPFFERGVDLVFDRVRIGSTILDARLQALISEGKARLLANPKIVTINGMEARFVAGDQIPYQTTKLAGRDIVYTTEFRDTGVVLQVTPTIQEDEYILLKVEPEVTGLTDRQDVILGGATQDVFRASLPVFSTRKIQTNVLVKSGDTLVMGGLYQTNTTEEIEKVPLLGDIPLLGLLFRNTRKSFRKAELVIFITPHIIRPGQPSMIPKLMEEEVPSQ